MGHRSLTVSDLHTISLMWWILYIEIGVMQVKIVMLYLAWTDDYYYVLKT